MKIGRLETSENSYNMSTWKTWLPTELSMRRAGSSIAPSSTRVSLTCTSRSCLWRASMSDNVSKKSSSTVISILLIMLLWSPRSWIHWRFGLPKPECSPLPGASEWLKELTSFCTKRACINLHFLSCEFSKLLKAKRHLGKIYYFTMTMQNVIFLWYIS